MPSWEDHYPTSSCTKGCREGTTCIDYLKYSRKEKIKELENYESTQPDNLR